MPQVRIYSPAKNAMQSGRAKSQKWVVEFEPSDRKQPDPLMGWNGSRDTLSQLRLRFDSKDAAVSYAEREGLSFTLVEPPASTGPKIKNYADNFSFTKVS